MSVAVPCADRSTVCVLFGGVVGLVRSCVLSVVGEPDQAAPQLAAMPSPPTAWGTVTLPSGVRDPFQPTR